jgi:hypothetical protein
MKSILALGMLAAAMTFCGLGDKLKGLSGNSGGPANSPANVANTAPKSNTGDAPADKATLTASQQSIADSATEQKWDEQGISWKLPGSWKKMSVGKDTFSYGSSDGAFLIATISTMASTFPSDVSLKATYDSSLEQLKQGKYEKARMLEIDGVKGVEWLETMPEDKSGPRRHQWIAFRNYQGQNQQVNIILSTKGSSFDKHRDDFPAVLYSMKIPKG